MNFTNEFETIISKFNSGVLQIPSFSEFNVEVKNEKQAAKKLELAGSAKNSLSSLQDKMLKRLTVLENEVNKLRNPNEAEGKIYLAMEYNNALMLSQNLPPKIDQVINWAELDGRIEFIFYLSDLLNGNQDLPEGTRHHLRNSLDKVRTNLGITEKLNEITEIGYLLNKVKEYQNLAATEIPSFEKKAAMDARVASAMHEAGQLNRESPLL